MADENERETLVWYGGEVKALGDGKVGGYLVRFTGPDAPDLEGDYFDASTDFGEIKSTPVYYQHGLDPKLKTRRLGVGELKDDEVGLWIDAQLNLRDEYERAIYQMAEAGKLGWSSGTASHLVTREQKGNAWHITGWPLGIDASLTPTPAEPRNTAVPIKNIEIIPTLEAAQEDQTVEAANETGLTDEAEVKAPRIEITSTSEEEMSAEEKEVKATETARMDAFEEQLKSVSDGLEAILKAVQESPKMERGGYVTNYGGTADPTHKSLPDFLVAIARRDHKRLTQVYKSQMADGRKDLTEGVGNQGGYLVPEEYMPLMRIDAAVSPVVSRVRRIPVKAPSGHWPTINYGVTPTAGSGQTALAGGLSAVTVEEMAALTETQPTFKDKEWTARKIGGYVEASNELIEDSPQAIAELISGLVGITINAKNERNVLRGSGAGEPLGILNADCTIAITTAGNDVFAEADALGMVARHKNLSGQTSVWIMNSGVIPDFASFSDSSVTPLVNFVDGVSGTLLGLPIIYSEHMPQANGDDVILADLGSYLFFERGGLEIAYSGEVGFLNDKGTWRFTARNDGFPWLNSAITEADPTGSRTVSPFLYHDD